MFSGLAIYALIAFFGEAITELISFVIEMTTAATATRISGSGAVDWLGRFMGIGIPLVIMFSSLNLVSASVKSGGFAGFGLWVKNTTAASIALVLIEPLVILGNNLAEGISWAIVQVVGSDLADVDVSHIFALEDSVLQANPGMAALMLLSVPLVLISSYLVLIVLSVRNVLLYFMMVVGAIAVAGLAWEKTAAWPRKWLSIMLGLLFAKLGVFLVLAIGVGLWVQPPPVEGNSYAQMIGNQTIMAVTFIVAAVAPFLAFKLFDFMGDGLANALHQPSGAGRTLVNSAMYKSRSGGLMSKINANKTAASGAAKAGASKAAVGAASKVHPAGAVADGVVKGGKKVGSAAVSEPLAGGSSSPSPRVSLRAGGGKHSHVSSPASSPAPPLPALKASPSPVSSGGKARSVPDSKVVVKSD